MNKIQSIVIVNNPKGATATLRFTDPRTDCYLSITAKEDGSIDKKAMYNQIEKYVAKVINE